VNSKAAVIEPCITTSVLHPTNLRLNNIVVLLRDMLYTLKFLSEYHMPITVNTRNHDNDGQPKQRSSILDKNIPSTIKILVAVGVILFFVFMGAALYAVGEQNARFQMLEEMENRRR